LRDVSRVSTVMAARDPFSDSSDDTGADIVEEAPELVQRLLTPSEVAAVLRVSPMTVYRMVRGGAVRALRVGRQLRIPAEDVTAYIARHTTPIGEQA